MKKFVFVIAMGVLGVISANGGARRAPAPPVPSPKPLPSSSPMPSGGYPFVILGSDTGASVDRAFAQRALGYMNRAFVNGCLRASIEAHGFKSLNTVFDVSPSGSKMAAQEYLAGAPYALDLRWYKKLATRAIGYTYNFRDNDWSGKSETRIWTNTRKLGNEKMYASHLAHELSHQARAGGFVHYTIFGGSFPYDIGDIMANCVAGM